MIRIGYAPGAFDLFHIGRLNLLRRAKEHCDFLIAGVVADDVLIQYKNVTAVICHAERLEIVRNVRFVDMVHAAMTNDKTEIWKELRFNVLFKGDDWRGTEKGRRLENDFAALGVEVVYFPYTQATSSTVLRQTLRNIDAMANRAFTATRQRDPARGLIHQAGIGWLRATVRGSWVWPPGLGSDLRGRPIGFGSKKRSVNRGRQRHNCSSCCIIEENEDAFDASTVPEIDPVIGGGRPALGADRCPR